MDLRARIRAEINDIVAFDEIEAADKLSVLEWIDSGAELCRRRKPDTPPKHLIVYFVIADGGHFLLVDHIKSGLWLPAGGHVDPGEHPRIAVAREAGEELGLTAEFLRAGPVFLSICHTGGKTAGHTDVALWYVLKGDRGVTLEFDGSEFNRVKWYRRNAAPSARTDPQLGRFLDKYFGSAAA